MLRVDIEETFTIHLSPVRTRPRVFSCCALNVLRANALACCIRVARRVDALASRCSACCCVFDCCCVGSGARHDDDDDARYLQQVMMLALHHVAACRANTDASMEQTLHSVLVFALSLRP